MKYLFYKTICVMALSFVFSSNASAECPDLFEAVMTSDAEFVRTALVFGTDPNASLEDCHVPYPLSGYTLPYIAVYVGNEDVIDLLRDDVRVNWNTKGPNGYTAERFYICMNAYPEDAREFFLCMNAYGR